MYCPRKTPRNHYGRWFGCSNNFDKLKNIFKLFSNNSINLAIFIDPEEDQLIATHKLGIKTIEFHTGSYANAFIKNANDRL